jgi:hypothetical protein
MDADERALRILEEFARAPREVGPVMLSQEYLEHIAMVESLPENQSGADKTSCHRAQSEFFNHYRRVQQL